MLRFERTTDIESPIYRDALEIRLTVFVNEQNVSPAIEIDEKESSCIHVVGYDHNHNPIATARLFPLDKENYKVQRVAVLLSERGKQLGNLLMNEMETIARENGAKRIILGAQNQALPFYKKIGYTVFGDEYEEAGILHHDVEKMI
ncbi:GNAT family N-acetyltransferase [Jeotgalibaca porci]|uniref:GNAT family N-acetyltransferase n=1 Tax=Jeotgalibaca porci TaxID=1868793 RepID=UPI00359F4129